MWPNSEETADLVTSTEEILNRKLHFLVQNNDILEIIHQYSELPIK